MKKIKIIIGLLCSSISYDVISAEPLTIRKGSAGDSGEANFSTSENYEVYKYEPADFKSSAKPYIQAAGAFIEYEDKILFLKRHLNKPEAGCYGIPGGKIDKGETSLAAVIREVGEETGIILTPEEAKKVQIIGTNFQRHPSKLVSFSMYRIVLDRLPEIKLSVSEHTDHSWVHPDDAMSLKLMPGEIESLVRYYEALRKQMPWFI